MLKIFANIVLSNVVDKCIDNEKLKLSKSTPPTLSAGGGKGSRAAYGFNVTNWSSKNVIWIVIVIYSWSWFIDKFIQNHAGSYSHILTIYILVLNNHIMIFFRVKLGAENENLYLRKTFSFYWTKVDLSQKLISVESRSQLMTDDDWWWLIVERWHNDWYIDVWGFWWLTD